jgi:FkbM family methyltransferase
MPDLVAIFGETGDISQKQHSFPKKDMPQSLTDLLASVERLANAGKLSRLLRNPFRYARAVAFNKLVYAKSGRRLKTSARLFWGSKMAIALPASTDIYLTGGKSHPSEIRLARFMIGNLKQGDHFLDIGAHYGYFTLLARELVGGNGKIISFEPSSESFELLSENVRDIANISARQMAVSHANADLVFYEFPNQYSEYNTTDIAQFEKESWFDRSLLREVHVPATTIDEITDASFTPAMIKIDVEGGELDVIKGGQHFLTAARPVIAMEYLEPKRGNANHKQALALLMQLGYHPCIINHAGKLESCADADAYLERNKLESDNIVMVKEA